MDVFRCITLNFLSLQPLDGNASPLLRTSQDDRKNRIEGRTRHHTSTIGAITTSNAAIPSKAAMGPIDPLKSLTQRAKITKAP